VSDTVRGIFTEKAGKKPGLFRFGRCANVDSFAIPFIEEIL
jgi:hypothetical protein